MYNTSSVSLKLTDRSILQCRLEQRKRKKKEEKILTTLKIKKRIELHESNKAHSENHLPFAKAITLLLYSTYVTSYLTTRLTQYCRSSLVILRALRSKRVKPWDQLSINYIFLCLIVEFKLLHV